MTEQVRILELLKLRFGESNMHNCEVMLKDIKESKRVNTNIKKAALTADAEATEDDEEQVTTSLLGLHTDVKPLLSRSTTGEFNSPPKYLRTRVV